MEQSLMDTRFFIHVPGDQPSGGQRPWVHEVHRTAVSSATAGNNAHARHWVHKVKFQLVGTIHFFKHMIYYYFFNYNLLFWQRFAAALLPRLFWTKVSGHTTRAPPGPRAGMVRTGDQRYPALCHCQLGQVLHTCPVAGLAAWPSDDDLPCWICIHCQ